MKLVATRRVEHAIRVLTYLSSLAGARASADEVASGTGIAKDSVRQLMHVLTRAKLVGSVSGPSGGYWLTCVPKLTKMRTVVEACEGPIDPSVCGLLGVPCASVEKCAIHAIWSSSQAGLSRELSKTSLADAIRHRN